MSRRSTKSPFARRRFMFRLVFMSVIFGTAPFYLLGFVLLGSGSDSEPTPTPDLATLMTNTPIQGEPTETLLPTWTLRATSTNNPLFPTAYQYIPPSMTSTTIPTAGAVPSSTQGL